MPLVVGRFTGPAFAILRIVAGLMFFFHGTQKIFGYPPMEMKGPLPPIAVAAGWIELVCGALIVIGLFGGLAAFIASGEMAVGYFIGHASHGGMNPLQNKGELAVVYCFLWLYVAAHGSGIWSLDGIVRRRRPVVATG